MYNRYIPQPDGSYRRSQVPERQFHTHRPQPPPEHPPEPEPEIIPPDLNPPCRQCQNRPLPQRSQPRSRKNSASDYTNFGVGNFLKNLLPGNFDTEDLLVVLLLLLMSGENHEDRNIPLLTLALYLFL